MSQKTGTVAPKERINVTFKPATGGAQEEIELPLKIAVIGDFLHRYDDRQLEERKPININKSNFNEVLAKQELSVSLSAPNKLSDDEDAPEEIPVQLKFTSMRDFEPGGVATQVPELKQLLDLREALISLKGPLGNIPAFRSMIEEVLKNSEQREKILEELGVSKESAPQ